jgi:uncharacterized protein (TIGR02300 family)
MTMVATPLDRGLRRRCTACRAPFYDLRRDPIVCPMCGVVQVPPVAAPGRSRGVPMRFRNTPPSDQVAAPSPAETVSEDEEEEEEKEEKEEEEENDEEESDKDEGSEIEAPELDDDVEEPGSERST